mmetsp:Transcript_20114/g.77129  ORF Transcript_20114/g.77129 Transcript_20114/m.77129 type:complete len:534 (-) Transcript_20114:46-1647(-)
MLRPARGGQVAPCRNGVAGVPRGDGVRLVVVADHQLPQVPLGAHARPVPPEDSRPRVLREVEPGAVVPRQPEDSRVVRDVHRVEDAVRAQRRRRVPANQQPRHLVDPPRHGGRVPAQSRVVVRGNPVVVVRAGRVRREDPRPLLGCAGQPVGDGHADPAGHGARPQRLVDGPVKHGERGLDHGQVRRQSVPVVLRVQVPRPRREGRRLGARARQPHRVHLEHAKHELVVVKRRVARQHLRRGGARESGRARESGGARESGRARVAGRAAGGTEQPSLGAGRLRHEPDEARAAHASPHALRHVRAAESAPLRGRGPPSQRQRPLPERPALPRELPRLVALAVREGSQQVLQVAPVGELVHFLPRQMLTPRRSRHVAVVDAPRLLHGRQHVVPVAALRRVGPLRARDARLLLQPRPLRVHEGQNAVVGHAPVCPLEKRRGEVLRRGVDPRLSAAPLEQARSVARVRGTGRRRCLDLDHVPTCRFHALRVPCHCYGSGNLSGGDGAAVAAARVTHRRGPHHLAGSRARRQGQRRTP